MKLFIKAYDTLIFDALKANKCSLEDITRQLSNTTKEHYIAAIPSTNIKALCNTICPISKSLTPMECDLIAKAMFLMRSYYYRGTLSNKAICKDCEFSAKCKYYPRIPHFDISPNIMDAVAVLYGYRKMCDDKTIAIENSRWINLSSIAWNVQLVSKVSSDIDKEMKSIINETQLKIREQIKTSAVNEKEYLNATLQQLKRCKSHQQKLNELRNLIRKYNSDVIAKLDGKDNRKPNVHAKTKPQQAEQAAKKSIKLAEDICNRPKKEKRLSLKTLRKY